MEFTFSFPVLNITDDFGHCSWVLRRVYSV